MVTISRSDSEYWRGEAERWRGEAERWRGEAERLAEENATLRARVAELEDQVAALSEKVATLAKLVFGDSSEQRKPGKSEPDDADGGEHSERRRRGQQPGSRGHGRRDYSRLETVEEIHDVPEGERFCSRCDAAYVPFGEECSEQIDWQVRIVRIVHRRRTYRRSCRCPVRGVLVAPPPPRQIRKGLFTAGFLARLLVDKYVLGRPLCRVVAALRNDGLEVSWCVRSPIPIPSRGCATPGTWPPCSTRAIPAPPLHCARVWTRCSLWPGWASTCGWRRPWSPPTRWT